MTGNERLIYKGHGGFWTGDGMRTLAWSPDGKYIASASNHQVHIWEAMTGIYKGHGGFSTSKGVRALAWSPDGKYVALGGDDSTIQIWDTINGNERFTYKGHKYGVRALAWSPDGKYIASGGGDKIVQVWNAI
jgi:WD40 repeat protein